MQTLQPFPLLSQQTLDSLTTDTKVKLNTELITLHHQCSYKWGNLPNENADPNELRMLAVTWNMQGIMPGYSLKRLFQIGLVHHDLIIIGTQECSRSIGLSIFCESKVTWEQKLQAELGKQYVKIQSVSLNAMHLIVFAHISLVPRIRNGHKISLSQGFLNLVANKGGIGLQVTINDKVFMFVNSHLHSGQDKQQSRCEQFTTLENHIQKKSNEWDYLVWMGDFNSRIDIDIKQNQFKIDSDFVTWMQKDQLFLSRQQDEFQNEFTEGMIYFPPTYKLEPRVNVWAQEKDYRIPGWTDRILFKESCSAKAKNTNQVMPLFENRRNLRLENYDANFEILGSDHRPVFAQFTVVI